MAELTQAADLARREDRLPTAALERGLRRHAARGTIINATFQVGLAALNLLRRVVVAAFLTASQFGVWGAILATLFLAAFIKDAGTGDRFVQQAEADQERAFQKLFTIDLLLGGVVIVLGAIALPIFALAYGRSEIIVPGLVLCLAVIGGSLQSPNVIYYRRMDFVRQRTLQAVDPVTSFVLTVALAIAGAGYWSLVIGAVVGSFAGAGVALWMCPYRLRFRLERGTIRDYYSFSWPLVVARGGGLAVGQASLLIATRTIGLAAAGAIALSLAITQFSRGVDAIVTSTLYPAICAVRERADLLSEAFIKSNRLALMWGMPFGLGVALFAPDLVHFLFSHRWENAIVVLQAFGIVAALDQIAFNWTAFLRALGYTRPLATLALMNVLAFLVITSPLLIAFGLHGFAAGVIAAEAVTLAGRTYFLGRLFPSFQVLRQAVRAIAPAVPAVAIILLARLVESGERTAALAAAELLVYAGLTVAATVAFERRLLKEVFGYLRPSPDRTGGVAAAHRGAPS
jgi:O-antigen/teichoic acid export membrane protein